MKYLLIIPFFISCSVQKNISKNSTKETTTTQTETAISRTITEKLDTNIVVKSDSLKIVLNENKLFSGDTIKTEDANFEIKQVWNKEKKELTTITKSKTKIVHASINRTTQEKITENKKEVTKKESKTFDKKVKRNYWSWWWLLLLIPVYFVWRKLKI